MLARLAHLINARPGLIVITMLIIMGLAGFFGGGVATRLTSGGFDDHNSQSYKASQRINDDFKVGSSNVVLLITAKDGSIDDSAVTEAALKTEADLKAYANMGDVASYWSLGKPSSLKGKDGKQAIIVGTLKGNADEQSKRIADLTPAFTRDESAITVGVGGAAEINRQFAVEIEKDLQKAELIALPITLILLILVFRSIIAGFMPILIGVFAILGSFLILYLMTFITEVSIYALNLTTMLGLGLAIDYSLFIVSRFRERLSKGATVDEAIAEAVEKAGKTVLFSALTVAVSLAALLVFAQSFLRSFAIAGVAVSLVAAFGSLVLLPALLKLLGRRVNSLSIGHAPSSEEASPLWSRIAGFVMARPLPVALVIIIGLLIAGRPFLQIDLGTSDERALPKTNAVRLVHDDLRANFTSKDAAALQIVSQEKISSTPSETEAYAISLSKVVNIDHVVASTGVYSNGTRLGDNPGAPLYANAQGVRLDAVPNVEPISDKGEQLTRDIRAVSAPFPTYVGGVSAHLTDLKTSLYGRLPIAIGLISLATLILLFMMFGSLLVPLKALAINFLSLSAVFGILVAIFQEGHLSRTLGFTPTGMIDATMPILMFCVAFGLSMDYEVFLLSRIKEYYDATKNNTEAVAHGLEKTGGIVTAAAVSISVVFIAFATSGVTIIKLFGLGLAIAVLLDAFVIRATLVPAFMKLAGAANWWAPKPLKRFYERFGISE